jgi:hypothetical protein
MKLLCRQLGAALAVGVALSAVASAQIKYRSGQNVVPIYEGWHKNADGSIDMLFGYLNRNWEEDLQIPVGADNSISGLPGGADQGQPTIFAHRAEGLPLGRHQFVFRVRVPKDFSASQQVVWSLTAHGRTDKVIATLLPVEEVDDVVIAENRGGGIIPGNKPPTVKLSASAQKVTTSEPVRLTAVFTDDGLPKRRASGGEGASRGPRVVWVYHRGPAAGAVKFDPPVSPLKEGSSGTVETTVTFSAPGTYVLRAFAEDPALYSTADVTITVGSAATTTGN